MQERLTAHFGSSERDARIYVSRSRLSRQTSSPVLEDVLEENLKAEGYDIVYPEALALREQMAVYHGAGTILGTSGSALHLAVMCMDERTRFGLVLRMLGTHTKFLRQARDMGATAGHVSGFIGELAPLNVASVPGRKWSDAQQVFVLDLARIWAGLHEQGFVRSARLPKPPSASCVQERIDAGLSRLAREHPLFTFAFVPTGS